MAQYFAVATISVVALLLCVACAGEQFCIGYTEDLSECSDTCTIFMLGFPNCSDPTQVPAADASTAAMALPKPPRPPHEKLKSLEVAAAATAKTPSHGEPMSPSAPPSDSCFCCCTEDLGE